MRTNSPIHSNTTRAHTRTTFGIDERIFVVVAVQRENKRANTRTQTNQRATENRINNNRNRQLNEALRKGREKTTTRITTKTRFHHHMKFTLAHNLFRLARSAFVKRQRWQQQRNKIYKITNQIEWNSCSKRYLSLRLPPFQFNEIQQVLASIFRATTFSYIESTNA